ncbi:MAG: hypothetical protein HOB79_01955 [Rhodospirillaceae bacterium]|nr:hypothetical protein [Rhodospirillaceae bacterium]
MAESEQRLLDAIENLDEGFVFFDADDHLVIANTTYKKMYPAQTSIKPGTLFDDAIALSIQAGEVPSAVGNEKDWIERRLAQHREFELVEEQYLLDGRWVRVSERRATDGGSVGVRADITALKESQMAAEAANRAKTAFLAHMSHVLRTPLNSIIGFSEVLREQIFGQLGERNQEYADNIHHSGVHLLSLISDILDISKVEVGELQPYDEDVPIADIAVDYVAMMRPKAIEKGLRMEIEAPNNLPLLRMDLRHLKQILLNLLSNAIKFTGRGGQIVLACENGPVGGTRISVTDTGIGIPPSDQAKVFEPFSQVSNPEIRSGEGTGLGLYLVKSLTELNGGQVSLVSKVGDGTTVSLTFPVERQSIAVGDAVN